MGKTQREQTYGGRLVENIVQAVARDVMCYGALEAMANGFNIFMLVHDEVVALSDAGHDDANRILMKQSLLSVPGWCAGLPLDAEVKSMDRYSK
jgi:DNA polymerase